VEDKETPKEQTKMCKAFCCRNHGYQMIELEFDEALSLDVRSERFVWKLEKIMVDHKLVDNMEQVAKLGSAIIID
jgi:hypothetical protein